MLKYAIFVVKRLEKRPHINETWEQLGPKFISYKWSRAIFPKNICSGVAGLPLAKT